MWSYQPVSQSIKKRWTVCGTQSGFIWILIAPSVVFNITTLRNSSTDAPANGLLCEPIGIDRNAEDLLDNIHSFHDPSEHRVLALERRLRRDANEELAAVGTRLPWQVHGGYHAAFLLQIGEFARNGLEVRWVLRRHNRSECRSQQSQKRQAAHFLILCRRASVSLTRSIRATNDQCAVFSPLLQLLAFPGWLFRRRTTTI